MSTLQQANIFIEHFTHWVSTQAGILAVALVGSHAGNAASDDSDVDLVIITDNPRKYLTHTLWTAAFGSVTKQQIEDYGMLTSLRVWYEGGLEIEYGFATRAWARTPLDEGTKDVIEDGMRILFERVALLSPLLERKQEMKENEVIVKTDSLRVRIMSLDPREIATGITIQK